METLQYFGRLHGLRGKEVRTIVKIQIQII